MISQINFLRTPAYNFNILFISVFYYVTLKLPQFELTTGK